MAISEPNINIPTTIDESGFQRPPVQTSSNIFASLDPSISLETNKSNDLTILGVQLLIRGYSKSSITYNLGLMFPSLINQKIYFPFKTAIIIDDLYQTIGEGSFYEKPSREELITLFTTTDLISEVILNAKKRILNTFKLDEYKNYIVSNINQSIQKGIIKNNLNLLNEILFLNNSKININNKQFLIDDSTELKPLYNNFKTQLEKNTPINSVLTCNGIITVSPILQQTKSISSVTRLNLNLVIRGQRKGIVPNYDIGMSYSSLKGKTIYFPFTIKITKKDLLRALDLESYAKPSNQDLISVFTKPGLLRLAIKSSLKSGQMPVNTIDEAIKKDIIKNNINLINELLFSPKQNITIYTHVYTIHSTDGIIPEINKFKNQLISGKQPLSLKLQCNVVLNVLDSATPSDIEFKKLSCSMRKNLIIQDLEEILGTEFERDIKKDIKYLRRAPAISKYDYYRKKDEYYPGYYPQYFPGQYQPAFPGYLQYPGYPYIYSDEENKLKTIRKRKPITESIFKRGPITTSAFTTRPFSTASTLDTFTSPERISPSRFEERPTSNLEKQLNLQKKLQEQSYQYQYPYLNPYGPTGQFITPISSRKNKTRKNYLQEIKPTTRKIMQPTLPYQTAFMNPYMYPTQTLRKTKRNLKGGKKIHYYNKTIKK